MGTGLTGAPGRTLITPSTMTRSPLLRPFCTTNPPATSCPSRTSLACAALFSPTTKTEGPCGP